MVVINAVHLIVSITVACSYSVLIRRCEINLLMDSYNFIFSFFHGTREVENYTDPFGVAVMKDNNHAIN